MSRLSRLEARRVDSSISASRSLHEAYAFMDGSEVIRFIIGSMQPIDPVYTKNTYNEGERVKSQLSHRVADISDFQYQGSVPSDTHIRAHSDIDLLAFIGAWRFCKHPLKPEYPYKGDTKKDIRSMRSASARSLDEAFPKAQVNDAGSTSISLEGGSLRRKVDVVPAAWEDSIESEQSGLNVDRGVRVFDKVSNAFKVNYPFKSLAEIKSKDTASLGGLCKAARLMKSVKAEAGDVKISSYDITALAWNMPTQDLWHQAPNEMRIFENCRKFLRGVCGNQTVSSLLRVPDGTRSIFCDDGSKIEDARRLLAQFDALAAEVSRDLGHRTSVYDLIEVKAHRPHYEHKAIAN